MQAYQTKADQLLLMFLVQPSKISLCIKLFQDSPGRPRTQRPGSQLLRLQIDTYQNATKTWTWPVTPYYVVYCSNQNSATYNAQHQISCPATQCKLQKILPTVLRVESRLAWAQQPTMFSYLYLSMILLADASGSSPPSSEP